MAGGHPRLSRLQTALAVCLILLPAPSVASTNQSIGTTTSGLNSSTAPISPPQSTPEPVFSCASKRLDEYLLHGENTLSPKLLAIHGHKKIRLTSESVTGEKCIANRKNTIDSSRESIDTTRIYEHAREFCTDGDITILAGADYFGFGLSDSLDVCFGPLPSTSKETEQFCASDGSLCEIEKSAALAVQAITFLKFAMLARYTSARNSATKARVQATDPEVTKDIEGRSQTEGSSVIRDIYQPIILREVIGDKLLDNAILRSDQSFNNLTAVFDQSYPRFERSLDECNRMVPRTDAENNVLVDLCQRVGEQECIEDATMAGGGHISSCCAYNPLASLRGLGESALSPEGKCTFHHVCSENRKGIEIDLAQEKMMEQISPEVYGRHVQNLQREHGDFYRETDYFKGYGQGDIPHPGITAEPIATCPNLRLGDLPEAKLPSSLRNNTQNGYLELELAYDLNYSDVGDARNRCNSKYNDNMEGLFARCEQFCGDSSIPILSGTLQWGTNLENALETCFEMVNGTAEDESFCQSRGPVALSRLQESIAEFTSNITIFKSSKLVWVARMEDRMEALVQKAATFIDVDFNRYANRDRVRELVKWYEDQFNDLEQDKPFLIASGRQVQEAFQNLRQVYSDTFEDVKAFANTCDGTFPRTKDNQTVLALCTHGQSFCADESDMRWTFCCCSNNPMLQNRDSDLDICSRSKQHGAPPYANTMAHLIGGIPVTQVPAERRSSRQTQLKSGNEYYRLYSDGMARQYSDAYDPPLSTERLMVALSFCDNHADCGSAKFCSSGFCEYCVPEKNGVVLIDSTCACPPDKYYHEDRGCVDCPLQSRAPPGLGGKGSCVPEDDTPDEHDDNEEKEDSEKKVQLAQGTRVATQFKHWVAILVMAWFASVSAIGW